MPPAHINYMDEGGGDEEQQGVVTAMCPVLPSATVIKKFDRQNGGLIV